MKSWNSENYKTLVNLGPSYNLHQIDIESVVDVGGLPMKVTCIQVYVYDDNRDLFKTWDPSMSRGYMCESHNAAKRLSSKFGEQSCCNRDILWNVMFVVRPDRDVHPLLYALQVCPAWMEKHMPEQFAKFFEKIVVKAAVGEKEPLESRLKPYFVLPGCGDGSESLEKAVQGVKGVFVREQHENSRTGRFEIVNPVVGKVSAPPVVSQRGTCIPWWEREGLVERPMWTDR